MLSTLKYKMHILDHLFRYPPSPPPPSAEQPTSYVGCCFLHVFLLYSSQSKYFLYYERVELSAGVLQFLPFAVKKKKLGLVGFLHDLHFVYMLENNQAWENCRKPAGWIQASQWVGGSSNLVHLEFCRLKSPKSFSINVGCLMMAAVQAVVSSMASCGHTALQEFPHLLILSVSCSKYKHLDPTGLVLSYVFLLPYNNCHQTCNQSYIHMWYVYMFS